MKTIAITGTDVNQGRIPVDADLSGVMFLFQDRSGVIWTKGDGSDVNPTDDIRIDGVSDEQWEVSRDGKILATRGSFREALPLAITETKNGW